MSHNKRMDLHLLSKTETGKGPKKLHPGRIPCMVSQKPPHVCSQAVCVSLPHISSENRGSASHSAWCLPPAHLVTRMPGFGETMFVPTVPHFGILQSFLANSTRRC